MNYYIATSGTSGATTIVQLPLAFVRSGGIFLSYNQAGYIGSNGYWWSRASSSSTKTHILYINSTGLNPSGSDVPYFGFPLRCRTRTSEEKSEDEK